MLREAKVILPGHPPAVGAPARGASSSDSPEDGALLEKPKRRQKDVRLDSPTLTRLTFIHVRSPQVCPGVPGNASMCP